MRQLFPLITVVIPAYNAGVLLRDAVASIRIQGYPRLEIIIVDDGSDDDRSIDVMRHIARSSDCTCLTQQNSGPAAARNRAIEISSGDLIAFLDADDEWPCGKLDLQLSTLDSKPDLDLVLGRVQYIALPGATVPSIQFESAGNIVSHVHFGSGLFRRRAFEKVGLLDESLRFSEDHDWFLRAREQNLGIFILDEVTLLYRLHTSNMTMIEDSKGYRLPLVLKKSLDRRRKALGRAEELRAWSSHRDTPK